MDEARAASDGSRGAAPGGKGAGDSAGDSDSEGEFADGEGDSRRLPREAPTGRVRAAGVDRYQAASGGSRRAAPGRSGPDGDSSYDGDDSRRVRRQATPASSFPDTQGRRGPGRRPSSPLDAEPTRHADGLCAGREATLRDARAAVSTTVHLVTTFM